MKAAVLPAYLPDQKHWITIRIDFEEEEISYGKIKPEIDKVKKMSIN